MDTNKPRYWRTVRLAGTVACLLALLTLVAWYIPKQSWQSCMHAQMFDCSISEDNPINHVWGWTLLISLIGAISSASVALTNALFAWKKPKSLEKAMALFSISSLVTILTSVFLFWWVPKAFPGNTINWRHDQAMTVIWGDVFIVSTVLFIMSMTAAVTCIFLICRLKRLTMLQIIGALLAALFIIWRSLANR